MRIRSGLLLALLLGAGSHLRAEILYSMTDLGTLGGNYTVASLLNNHAQVAGDTYTADGRRHAFLYSNGLMADAGPGGAVYDSGATALNDNGQVAGYFHTTFSGDQHAFLYSNGVTTDLGTMTANSLNQHGQVVGNGTTVENGGHSFLYSNGVTTDLGPLTAIALNDNGQIAGSFRTAGGLEQAFLYSDGVITDLSTLVEGGLRRSFAQAVN